MSIFLIGNGYDLHHKFPTSYYNFLQTIHFLIEQYEQSYSTVGHIFGNETLQERDAFIKECYEKHENVYKLTCLPEDEIESMIDTAKENMWFNYLYGCVGSNMTWIDFEKEINRVLQAFSAFFDYEIDMNLTTDNRLYYKSEAFPVRREDQHILSHFDFFSEEMDRYIFGGVRYKAIKYEYVTEKIVGSGTYYLNVEAIVSKLYKSLRELANMLRKYLLYFVEAPMIEYVRLGIKPKFPGVHRPQRVYSFNYTTTVETLHNNCMVDHIHGDVERDIVLGVNPNGEDDVNSVDTTFLQFKKYFQRVFYNTDMDFLRDITPKKNSDPTADDDVYVIGHSLDSTDEDVIKKIFSTAKKIRILYHSDTSVKNQIRNLVNIYGKEGLDLLRENKELVFVPQEEITWECPTID